MLADYVEEVEDLFGQDLWPYGMKICKAPVARFASYCYEQGLTSRPISMAEIFPMS
jgi:hypothetical protein